MSDPIQDFMRKAITEGYTVWGPTEPRLVWDLPAYDDTQTPEWKALWTIADGEWFDEEARQYAIQVIGSSHWEPGSKPGWVPSLIEQMTTSLYDRNLLFDRVRNQEAYHDHCR